jgi:predicted amino acid dehydrogenase
MRSLIALGLFGLVALVVAPAQALSVKGKRVLFVHEGAAAQYSEALTLLKGADRRGLVLRIGEQDAPEPPR